MVAVAAALVAAQPAPDHLVVVTALPGSTATQLLDVDPVTGSQTPLGGFPLDTLPPIAVTFDRIAGDLVVAVQDNGFARIVRLRYSGTTLAEQRELATISEPVVDLGMDVNGDILAGADGPTGGVFLVPRMGGLATRVIAISNVSSLYATPLSVGVAAREIPGGQPELVEFYPGGGFTGIANSVSNVPSGTRLTGAYEMGTALVRHGMADTLGNAWMIEGYGNVFATATLPPGGTAEIIPYPGPGWTAMILGGAAAPNLSAFDATSAGPPTLIAGPLPGDPVDVTATLPATPRLEWFGTSCPPSIGWTWSGYPQLGSTMTLGIMAALPSTPVVLAFGLSDSSWGSWTLPLALPGGCQLLVSGDALFVTATDSVGYASLTFSIPGQPSLAGTLLFGQWVQANGPTYLATPAFAAHLWP